jgi:hypothetical protein
MEAQVLSALDDRGLTDALVAAWTALLIADYRARHDSPHEVAPEASHAASYDPQGSETTTCE